MCDKNDILILILTHGRLAEEFYNTAKMISGNLKNVFYFTFPEKMAFETLENKVKNFVQEHKDNGIIIFIDLFGGSCFNTCASLVKKKNIKIFSGVNLGILLEAIILKSSRKLDEIADIIENKKNDTIVYINKKLNE